MLDEGVLSEYAIEFFHDPPQHARILHLSVRVPRRRYASTANCAMGIMALPRCNASPFARQKSERALPAADTGPDRRERWPLPRQDRTAASRDCGDDAYAALNHGGDNLASYEGSSPGLQSVNDDRGDKNLEWGFSGKDCMFR